MVTPKDLVSFLKRSTRTWNTLSDELELSMDSLYSFKATIKSYYVSVLANDVDKPLILTPCDEAELLEEIAFLFEEVSSSDFTE